MKKIVYNAQADSMGTELYFGFVQVFEAQMKNQFPGIESVRVTFTDAKSGIAKIDDGGDCDPARYAERVGWAAESAWQESLKSFEYHGAGSPVPPYDPETDGDYSDWLVFNNID